MAKGFFFIGAACWVILGVSSYLLNNYFILFISLAMLAVNLFAYKFPLPDRSRFWQIFDAALPLLLNVMLLTRYFSSEN